MKKRISAFCATIFFDLRNKLIARCTNVDRRKLTHSAVSISLHALTSQQPHPDTVDHVIQKANHTLQAGRKSMKKQVQKFRFQQRNFQRGK